MRIIACCFVALLITAQGVNAQSARSRASSEEDVVRINTALVTVPVSVMDRDGKYILNLRREDFQLSGGALSDRVNATLSQKHEREYESDYQDCQDYKLDGEASED